MLEPPADLSTEQIEACLRAQYGLSVTEVSFIPLGHDPGAWVYRARTVDGRDAFIKVRLRLLNVAGLLAPHALQMQGIRQVVAPLPTLTGDLWTQACGYVLILYPFVDGKSGMVERLTLDQWRTYGGILRQIHAAEVTPEIASVLRHETFEPAGADLIRLLDTEISANSYVDAACVALSEQWRVHRETILRVLSRAEALGRQRAAQHRPLTLTHADVHTGNVLGDVAGGVWIVDWDEVMLSVPERDLMFIIRGIDERFVRPEEQAQALAGYGPVEIDPLALTFFRYAWAVSDISAFADTILHRPEMSVTSRLHDAELFGTLFAPSGIVGIALSSALS